MQFDEMIQIQERRISKDDPVFIIGEAGVNHNGDPDLAAKLVDVACEAGVDAVKFQMFKTEDLILHNVEKAPYQKEVTDTKQTQFEMLKKLELEKETFSKLKSYCEQKGILFLCTPFDQNSLEVLDSLGVPAFKIAATDVTNIQFLRQVAAKKKPIILSAGMCYLEEIKTALRAICPINQRVILLQCTANYPLDDREVNLNVMDTLRREFDILIGYSDHSRGIGAAPYAVAKGARVIEKHFTIDKNLPGPDHRASVTPEELKALVAEVRRVETFLGSGVKMPTYSEQFTRRSLQKCLVAKKAIEEGEVFSEDNLTAKRTNGKGISALYFDEVVGRRAEHRYLPDEIIQ